MQSNWLRTVLLLRVRSIRVFEPIEPEKTAGKIDENDHHRMNFSEPIVDRRLRNADRHVFGFGRLAAFDLYVELLSGDFSVAGHLNPEIDPIVPLYSRGNPFFRTGRQEELNGVVGRHVRRGSFGKSRHLRSVEKKASAARPEVIRRNPQSEAPRIVSSSYCKGSARRVGRRKTASLSVPVERKRTGHVATSLSP